MAITIHECSNTKDGCRIAFNPGQDVDMVIVYLESACASNGWEAGSADCSVKERVVVEITGPSCADFSSKLRADMQFDFSICKGCS